MGPQLSSCLLCLPRRSQILTRNPRKGRRMGSLSSGIRIWTGQNQAAAASSSLSFSPSQQQQQWAASVMGQTLARPIIDIISKPHNHPLSRHYFYYPHFTHFFLQWGNGVLTSWASKLVSCKDETSHPSLPHSLSWNTIGIVFQSQAVVPICPYSQ